MEIEVLEKPKQDSFISFYWKGWSHTILVTGVDESPSCVTVSSALSPSQEVNEGIRTGQIKIVYRY